MFLRAAAVWIFPYGAAFIRFDNNISKLVAAKVCCTATAKAAHTVRDCRHAASESLFFRN